MSWLRAAVVSLLSLRRRWQGLLAGCGVWLIWMVCGFWATLLLFVLAAAGFAVGLVLERNPSWTEMSWKEIVQKLLSGRFGE
ncbi:MAG: hypothetical protein K6T30_03475 [Alicyclobacillus sp.]|nr:hypothetical protein [Alicyclobacillus sp.]